MLIVDKLTRPTPEQQYRWARSRDIYKFTSNVGYPRDQIVGDLNWLTTGAHWLVREEVPIVIPGKQKTTMWQYRINPLAAERLENFGLRAGDAMKQQTDRQEAYRAKNEAEGDE